MGATQLRYACFIIRQQACPRSMPQSVEEKHLTQWYIGSIQSKS
jgi:hypothetical protein